MKYCSKCGEVAMGTMLMCANCGAKTFQDAPPSNTSENEQKKKIIQNRLLKTPLLQLPALNRRSIK